MKLWCLAVSIPCILLAQSIAPAGPQAASAPGTTQPAAVNPPRQIGPDKSRADYVLSAGDQIVIHAFEMEDISEKPYLIDSRGNVHIPMLGEVKAASQTVAEFQDRLTQALTKYVRQPQVSVTVTQFHTEPVFLLGAFKSPGIYTLEGKRTLVDMLAISGGLQPEASMQIKLTRRTEYGSIPLPNATTSTDGKTQSVTISLVGIGETANPAENIFIQPYDVISVERAEMIYVDGQIARSSGLTLNEKTSLSIVQIVSLSGGLGEQAKGKKAWILRPVPNSDRRTRIPLNIDRILSGDDPDVKLYPNDLLYVPKSSGLARDLGRALTVALPLATGFIYLAFR